MTSEGIKQDTSIQLSNLYFFIFHCSISYEFTRLDSQSPVHRSITQSFFSKPFNMLFLPLLALCGVALADGSNSTSFSWSMKPGPRPTPGPGGPGGPGLMSPPPNGFPGQIGDFQFYGCAASSAGFPSFTLTGSSEDMSLELCAVSCPSRFFGIYST